MTKRLVIAAALVAALAGAATVATAQGPRPGAPGPRMGLRGAPGGDLGLRGVQLTEAQRQQVRAAVEAHRAEREAVMRRLRESRRAFAEATQSGTVDETTVRSRASELATAMADEALLRARVRAEVHALLTPEQQQLLRDRQAAREKRQQEREQRLQQRRQQRPSRPGAQ